MTNLPVVKRIAFSAPPIPGTALLIEGQRFLVITVRPHRRQTGEPTTLITWVGHCAHCGREFIQDTGLVAKGLNRRCDEHRQPGIPVSIADTERRLRQLRKALRRSTKR